MTDNAVDAIDPNEFLDDFVNEADTEALNIIQTTTEVVTYNDIEDSIISDSTLKKYLPDLMHFIFWLMDNSIICLTQHCISLLRNYKDKASRDDDIFKIICNSKKEFMTHLRSAKETPLLDLKNVTTKLFMTYLITLKNRTTNTFYGRSAYNQRRSALFHLFRLHNNVGFDPIFKLRLCHLYTGWFRWLSKKGRGDRKGRKKNSPTTKNVAWSSEDPKLPLSVGAYKAIAGWLLADGTTESNFAHCFLVLTWNLACRSQNTAIIRFGDISWNTAFDAYTIKFAC